MSDYLFSGSTDESGDEFDSEEPGIDYLKRAQPSKKNFAVLYDLYASNEVPFPLVISHENDKKMMKPCRINKRTLEIYHETNPDSAKTYNKLCGELEQKLKSIGAEKKQQRKLAVKERRKAKVERHMKTAQLKWEAKFAAIEKEKARIHKELKDLKGQKQKLPTVEEEG